MIPDMRSLFCLVLLFSCASCATSLAPQAEPTRAVRAQMDVKAALLEADEVAAAPIRVQYREGKLYLSGYVETEAERVRAVKTARRALPDVPIVSNLEVWRSGNQ